MLDQIKISDPHTSYYEDLLKETVSRTPESFWLEAVNKAKHDIEYHTTNSKKEIERANERTQWVQQLRDSLK